MDLYSAIWATPVDPDPIDPALNDHPFRAIANANDTRGSYFDPRQLVDTTFGKFNYRKAVHDPSKRIWSFETESHRDLFVKTYKDWLGAQNA